MKQRETHCSKLSGSRKLAISDNIFEFIHRIVIAGIGDTLGSRATKQRVKKEFIRRLSL